MAFLASHPEIKRQLRASIHMDMVGGDPFKNKSIFHVTATPWSLPSFVTDVGATFEEVIRKGAADYAESGSGEDAAVVETRAGEPGTRNEFIADTRAYSSGSDHDDFDSSTIAVPSLYLNDWPDIYIHTDHDTLQQIDPSKLRRVALLGAAAGYAFANLDASQLPRVLPVLAANAEARLANDFKQAQLWVSDPLLHPMPALYEGQNLMAQALRRETRALGSAAEFAGSKSGKADENIKSIAAEAHEFEVALEKQAGSRGAKFLSPSAPWANDPVANKIPVRIGDFGPLTYQNDDVLVARMGRERVAKIKLLTSAVTPMLQANDQSELYAYEIVNFVDGKRSVGEIRDAVSAEFGPIAVDVVADYLDACAEAKIIAWR